MTKEDVDAVLAESIVDRVTPYAKYSYEEQLKRKHDDLRSMLGEFNKTLNHEIKKSNEVAPAWYSMLEGEKNLPLDPQIIACEDKLEGYRNKVEFTVGRIYEPAREGHDELWNQEAPICVGFNRSNLTKGIEFVEQPDDIKVNSKESIIAAKQFE